MENTLLAFDRQKTDEYNAAYLIGIDEVGRGPLAGPVVACACYVPDSLKDHFPEVNDSKKLTEKKRELINARAHELGVPYSLGIATSKEIDEINILQATFLAMRRAVEKFASLDNVCILVDGNHKIQKLNLRQEPVIGGDGKSFCIAMASVIAKVYRDNYMCKLAEKYPQYGFEGHKGYGAKTHMEAIEKYGPCPEHRMSFAPLKQPTFF
ncbi:ribonuclease HII [Parelusimicrobium proximum]|uniref:ribonuclease HII n=1 Tax=Parelusimicrobium proximum TaxID=3228953 RepID=UPI003D16714B